MHESVSCVFLSFCLVWEIRQKQRFPLLFVIVAIPQPNKKKLEYLKTTSFSIILLIVQIRTYSILVTYLLCQTQNHWSHWIRKVAQIRSNWNRPLLLIFLFVHKQDHRNKQQQQHKKFSTHTTHNTHTERERESKEEKKKRKKIYCCLLIHQKLQL